ncbi:MAG: hypothetical protein ABI120_10125 [Gemmatimonadaceae bacterium]
MARQRALRIALTLVAPLLLFFAPLPSQAQNQPGRVQRAVGHAVETLAKGAETAVAAFTGELPAIAQSAGERAGVSPGQRTKRALTAVGGVVAIGLIIALVVLVSAQEPLEAVARAAEKDISASFWVGVLSQALAIPIVLTVSLLLAVTIVLIPAIPIAMLAWALAYAGAFTLGLFAVALVLGRAVLGRSTTHNRSALLSSLMCGMIILSVVWVGAALVVSVPLVGILARLVALALTWVAATVGLGAVVRSRAGTVRAHIEVTTENSIPSWQTPTPVFGVVAARRPTPVSSSASSSTSSSTPE